MKIYLNQIPKTGLSATEKVDASPYELDTVEVSVATPLELSYHMVLEEENVLIQMSIRCTTRLICSRCLGVYETPFYKEVEWIQPVGKATLMDVTGDLREEILVEYPIKPLCQEGCKGICKGCGQNLNEVICHCVDQTENVKQKGKIKI